MYPHYDGEPEGLTDTRKIFNEQLDYYLSLGSPEVEATTKGASTIGASFVLLLFALFIWAQ
jgi:hypothetical protein